MKEDSDKQMDTAKHSANKRRAKTCLLCNKDIIRLGPHLRNSHKLLDKEVLYKELNRQKERRLLVQGNIPAKCPADGCPAIITDGRVDMHLILSPRHRLKRTDPAYTHYIQMWKQNKLEKKRAEKIEKKRLKKMKKKRKRRKEKKKLSQEELVDQEQNGEKNGTEKEMRTEQQKGDQMLEHDREHGKTHNSLEQGKENHEQGEKQITKNVDTSAVKLMKNVRPVKTCLICKVEVRRLDAHLKRFHHFFDKELRYKELNRHKESLLAAQGNTKATKCPIPGCTAVIKDGRVDMHLLRSKRHGFKKTDRIYIQFVQLWKKEKSKKAKKRVHRGATRVQEKRQDQETKGHEEQEVDDDPHNGDQHSQGKEPDSKEKENQEQADEHVDITRKAAHYKRVPKKCMLCKKVINRLDVHLQKGHKMYDRQLRNKELNKQKESRLLTEGTTPGKCPVPGCLTIIKDGRMDNHLTKNKIHGFKRTDPSYLQFIQIWKKERLKKTKKRVQKTKRVKHQEQKEIQKHRQALEHEEQKEDLDPQKHEGDKHGQKNDPQEKDNKDHEEGKEKKTTRYVRSPKVCLLCNKVVLRLNQHLMKTHKLYDRQLRYMESNRQRESRLLAQGKAPGNCPVPGCAAILQDKKIHNHLTKNKKHGFKKTDHLYEQYVQMWNLARLIQRRERKKPNKRALGRLLQTNHASIEDISDDRIYREAEIYYVKDQLLCAKNSSQYIQEMKYITTLVGEIQGKPPSIKLLYAGGTEVLTKVKDHLSSDKKPHTVKKYLYAVEKFSTFLQTNPMFAKGISQESIKAVHDHCRSMLRDLRSLMLSRNDSQKTHTALRPSKKCSKQIPSANISTCIDESTTNTDLYTAPTTNDNEDDSNGSRTNTDIDTSTAAKTNTNIDTSTAANIDTSTAANTKIDLSTLASTIKDLSTPASTNKDWSTATTTNTNIGLSTAARTNTNIDLSTAAQTDTNIDLSTAAQTDTNIDLSTPASTNIDLSTAASTNIDLSTPASTNIDLSTPASTNIDLSTAASTNIDLSTPASTNIDLSTAASTNIDLSTPASTNIDLSTPASTNTDLSTPASTNIDLSTTATTNANIDSSIAMRTKSSIDLSTAARTSTDLSSETKTNIYINLSSTVAKTNTNIYWPTATRTNTNIDLFTAARNYTNIHLSTAVRTDTNTDLSTATTTTTNIDLSTAAKTNTNIDLSTAAKINTHIDLSSAARTCTNIDLSTVTNTNIDAFTAARTNINLSTAANTDIADLDPHKHEGDTHAQEKEHELQETDNQEQKEGQVDTTHKKATHYVRAPKMCLLCNKVVTSLDQHLREAHKLFDGQLRNMELNRQMESCLLAQGNTSARCQGSKYTSDIKVGRINLHLTRCKRHAFKKTDDELFKEAEVYLKDQLLCDKNSRLYIQEMKTITILVGEILGKKPSIKLIYAGGTEILTKVKDRLSTDKKPNTVKKYLFAVMKFSTFLQTNPMCAKGISQESIKAVHDHCRTLFRDLRSLMLQSRTDSQKAHTAVKPPQTCSKQITSTNHSACIDESTTNTNKDVSVAAATRNTDIDVSEAVTTTNTNIVESTAATTNTNTNIDTFTAATTNTNIDTSTAATTNTNIDTSTASNTNANIETSTAATSNTNINTSTVATTNTNQSDKDTSSAATTNTDIDTSTAATTNTCIDKPDNIIRCTIHVSTSNDHENSNVDRYTWPYRCRICTRFFTNFTHFQSHNRRHRQRIVDRTHHPSYCLHHQCLIKKKSHSSK